MKHLCVLLLLLLWLPAAANDFETSFDDYLAQKKLSEISTLVSQDPAGAELLFRKYLGVLLKTPGAEKEKNAANVLARALLFVEKDIPTQVLTGSRLIFPTSHWDGTAFDQSKKPGPSAEAIAKQKALEEQRRQGQLRAQQEFRAKFKQPETTQEWAQIARLVQYNPQIAPEVFESMHSEFLKNPSDPESKALVNLLARALLVNGNDGPSETLKEAGHLFASSHWDATILEDDERLKNKPSTIAKNMQSSGATLEENTEAALKIAISVGNLEASKLLLPEIKDASKAKLLETVAYESAGLSRRAWQLGKSLPSSLYLQCCLSMAARQTLATDRLPSHLNALEKELSKAQGTDAQIGHFILESQRFWLQSLKQKPEFDDLLNQHEKAWAHLEKLDVQGLDPGYARWLTRSATVWLLGAQKLSDAEAKDYPHRAQLQYLISKDMQLLENMNERALEESFRFQPAEPVQFKQLWNPEFFLGVFEMKLDFVRYHRQRGEILEAQKALENMKPLRLSLHQKFQEANFAYQASTMKFGNGNLLLFSWFEGHVLRLLGLYHAQLANQWLKREPFGNKAAFETEAELNNAREFQEQSKGHFGLDDWKWSLLAYQIQATPNGWEQEATQLSRDLLDSSKASGSNPAIIEALRLQGSLQARKKQSAAAIESLQEAVALVEKITSQTGSGFREQYRKIYEELAELLLEAGKDAEAFEILGRGAQVQQVVTRARRVLSVEREREEAAAGELVAAQNSGGDVAVEEKVLASTQAEFYSAMRKLRTENPTFGSRLAIRPVGFSRIQKLLPPKTALIQYFPSPRALYIFVVDQKNFTVHQVPVTEAKLSRMVKDFRRDIQRLAPLGEQSSKLHELLLKPVQNKIQDKELLVFVPTGNLFYLPFSALAEEKDGQKRYLVEDHQVAIVTKSSDLLALSTAHSKASTSMLALGNPDGTLPGAEEEVNNLKGIFPDLKIAAKDQTILKKLGSSNTLHLATHGVVNRREPLESYLVLEGEHKLTLSDISGTDLSQLKMVTLSACETAISSEKGHQGEVATLADSFSFAGVPTLVASLWKVSDQSTGQLMLSFYGHLKEGKSSAEALTMAQRALLDNRTTAHPYYWAPFMIMGDWR